MVEHGERTLQPIPETELLRLRVGEAYLRFGHGLAFKVGVDPPRMSEHEAQTVIEQCRARYAGNQEEKARERTVARPDIKEAPPTERPDVVESPGRGGPEHIYLQSLLKQYGEDHGFRASIEHELPGGGRVD